MKTSSLFPHEPKAKQKYLEKRQMLIRKNIVTEEQMQQLEQKYHPKDILSGMLCDPRNLQELENGCEWSEMY